MSSIVTYMAFEMTDISNFDWRSEFRRLEGAYAPATMKCYYTDVEIFEAWCRDRGRAPFPAETGTVCEFLEDQAVGRAASTVRRRIYSIRKVHRLLRLPDPTRDEDINLSLRRVRRSQRSRPKQRLGCRRDYLEQFIAAQDDTVVGVRNRAILALGYELLARRSELSALRLEDLTWQADGTLSVLIRRSKTDPFGAGRLAFTSQNTRKLIDDWIRYRGLHIHWLFCPVYFGKAIARPLAPETLRDIIKDAARRAGLDATMVRKFGGHSLRIGAAQDLLAGGHDTAAIMRAGGWKSVEVLARYLEAAEHNVWA